MVIECDDIGTLADAYYHKALPAEVMEAFTLHMQQCRGNCRWYIREYKEGLTRRMMVFWEYQPAEVRLSRQAHFGANYGIG